MENLSLFSTVLPLLVRTSSQTSRYNHYYAANIELSNEEVKMQTTPEPNSQFPCTMLLSPVIEVSLRKAFRSRDPSSSSR
jgi:hypothetical protein